MESSMDGRFPQLPQQQGAMGPLSGTADTSASSASASTSSLSNRKKPRRGGATASQKRRCVSTACVACRKRKSKCDGAVPSCAACASVYGTECIYDPHSDHRRKGVYREKIDSMKARNSTLQILVEAILNAAEDDVPEIVKKIRTCDSLDNVAETILKEGLLNEDEEEEIEMEEEYTTDQPLEGERELARKMGELRLENGSVRFIGGTSHLIYLGDPTQDAPEQEFESFVPNEEPIATWTQVTKDTQLISHLMNMYFFWHYPYFTTLSKTLFYRHFLGGKYRRPSKSPSYCSSLLVNAMLALGCHFTSVPGAFAVPGDTRSKGDHFFAEAKRLIVDNDEYEKPRLTTVQALALMSVREAGCGREAKGWVYSGMSFRMAQDIGLNLDADAVATDKEHLDEQEIDARRITFWGCFLFDKCWSNYLGRLPQLPKTSYNVPKYDVFPDEDAEPWCPYTDSGFDQSAKQPSRTRAIGLQLSKLCEISSDLLLFFYHPNHIGRSSGKSVELKKLSELHRRLEDWRAELPREFEAKDGQLPNVILMHMFFHLQYIHLFRPFLKYVPSASPLPAHVSPRRICTANAGAISKLMRLYKKTYNLRQICNIAVYMVHSACTIHMLNLPEKTAKRDIIHGVKHLEEIAEDWLCARRTLGIISVLARKWKVDLPEEASHVLQRTDEKYGTFNTSDVPSPASGGPSLTASMSPSSPVVYGSPTANPDQFGSVQFNQPTPPQIREFHGTGDLSNNFAALGTSTSAQGQVPKQLTTNPVGNAPISLGGALAAVNAWTVPEVPPQQPPLQSYQPQPFTHAQKGSLHSARASSSQAATRQVTANSVFGIDGPDWFLKDGVSWQQNFETWGLAPAPGSSANPSGGGGGGSGGLQDPSSMFTFRGMRGSADDGGAFESFKNSMRNLDHLPGLD